MTYDATLLALGIESSEVKTGTDRLADLEVQAGKTEAATKRLTETSAKQNDASKEFGMNARLMAELTRAQEMATLGLSDRMQRLIAQYDPLGAKLRSLQADFAQLNREVMAGAGAGQEGAIDLTYKRLNEEIAKTKGLMQSAGIVEGFNAQGKSAIGAAFSTAQARRELIVLGHEAITGNFSRMPGSFMVLAERISLSGAAITMMLGTVVPLVAVFGTLIAAFIQGRHEQEAMNDAMFKSGNIAGTTRGQMLELATSIAKTGELSLSTSKSLITDLVASGKIGSESLKAIAGLAADYARATGADVAKLGPELVKLFEDPAKGAEKLNESMHFLTIGQLEHIKALERAGELGQAQLALADSLKGKFDTQEQSVGTLTKAWRGLMTAAGNAWDAMLNIGRDKTPEQAVAAQQAIVDALQAKLDRGGTAPNTLTQQRLEAARQELALLTRNLTTTQQIAEADGKRAEQNRQVMEFYQATDNLLSSRLEKVNAEIALAKKNHDLIIASGLSEQKYAERLVDLEKQRDDLLKKRTGSARKEGLTADDQLWIKDMQTIADLMSEASEHGAAYDKVLEALNRRYLDGTLTLDQYVDAEEKLFDTKSKVSLAMTKAYEQEAKAREQSLAAYDKSIDAIDREVEKVREHAAVIGLSKEQVDLRAAAIADATLAQKESTLAELQARDERSESIAMLQREIQALKDLRDARRGEANAQRTQDVIEANKKAAKEYERAWLGAIDTVAQRAGDFAVDFKNKGMAAFKDLWGSFVDWGLRAIAQIMARKVIISLVGESGGLGAPASGVGGLLGGNGGVGNILSLGKFFGLGDSIGTSTGSVLASLFGPEFVTGAAGIAETFAAAGAGAEALVGFGTEVAAASGALAGFGAAAVAVVPVIGWIAAAALIAWQIWGNKGGGPKSGGFASSGDVSGISGTDNSGRYFTPNQADSELVKTLASAQEGYLQIAKALNLKVQNVGFALGFDTDPLGTAANQVHAGTFVNGQQVYNYASASGELGRDDKQLQERLALETKRIVFAALQASLGDAPKYLQQLFEGVDAATVTSEQIDQILQTAQALQIVVTAISGMGEQFAAMDADQITALVEAFGGLQNFLDSATFLKANFTTDAEKTAQVTQQLNDAFAALNIAVPQSHDEFMKLLEAQDLTTEAGRATYAALSRLAPAFVAVHGTAQQAADAAAQLAAEEAKLTEQRKQAIAAATDFFNANFYTAQEQAASKLQANWEIVHNAWTQMGEQLLALGHDHIPTTNAAFRQLIESLRAGGFTELADSLILIAPAIFDINQAVSELTPAADEAAHAIDGMTQAMTRAEEAANAASTLFQQVSAAIEAIVSQSGGDFGDKAALRLTLVQEQIKRYEALIAQEQAINPYGPLIVVYQNALAQLKALNNQTAAQLARFTILEAQYGAAKAEQLVALEEWYRTQQAALGGQVEALAALQVVFDAKWKEIVEGIANGVEGAISELERIQKSLRDWLDNILLGELSPLTPQQKLSAAEQQYLDLLKKAQGGDLEALSKLSGAADEYLKQAREFFASSPQYTAIFESVIAAIKALALPPVAHPPPGVPGGSPGPSAPGALPPAFVAAIPSRGKMVSDEDLKEHGEKLAARIIEGLNAHAQSNANDAETVVEAIKRPTPAPEVLK